MAEATRRDVLAVSGLALAAMPGVAMADDAVGADGAVLAQVAADLDHYIGFGIKASGGAGDNAAGAWLQHELEGAGFLVERQAFDAPWFDVAAASLQVADTTAPLLPQAIVVPTGPAGGSGPLVRVDPVAGAGAPLNGAIALLDLPAGRWSSALAKPIREPVTAAFAAGAVAVAIVTNGPSGAALALNADGGKAMFAGPVAVLAPKQARRFLVGAGRQERAAMILHGRSGRRAAFNLIGRIDRGKDRWVVVSTPRSGWFGCAGERGPGVAAWLALARWAGKAMPDHNLAFVCNSGHEYENLGSEKALDAAAPAPDRTALWLHLGANVAARDWHEPGGGLLLPLPSADPQRFLVTSPALVPAARRAVAGLAGLEMAYPTGQGTAGELTNILAAGYGPVAGIFGAHRFHHAVDDDARCVHPPLVVPVIRACQALIRGA